LLPALSHAKETANSKFDTQKKGNLAWHEYFVNTYHSNSQSLYVALKFIRIDRSYPVTLSFRAKSKPLKNKQATLITALLLVPSWHYGFSSAPKYQKITDE